ncbi:hypothetical protein A2U01_0027254, partial [Trifolium medium]|nr:hypothetical protein [Trifolium medium]
TQMDLVKGNSMQLNKFTSWAVDDKIKAAVEKTCFKYFLQFPNNVQIKVPLQMFSALLYFYDEDEACFMFGEEHFAVDIGLEDILFITGLPIDGKQELNTRTLLIQLPNICQ